MPGADLLARLGLFVVADFLDQSLCEKVRSEAAAARSEQATVRRDDDAYGVDEKQRRTKQAQVPEADAALVRERLLAVMPEIGEHFGVELTGMQPLQFLIYSDGDFFVRHADRGPGVPGATYAEERQVSVVLFLNGESAEPSSDTYSGGALTLYELLGDDDVKIGLPVPGETGLLVAFQSEMIHEVTPVTRGKRYSVVTWFF